MARPRKEVVAARLAARPEEPPREPERGIGDNKGPVFKNRDGRVIDVARVVRQGNDPLDLAALGIFPPQGWKYSWRTRTVANAQWTRQIVEDDNKGYTPVPADRHPGLIMPRDYKGPIEYNGLMLMEIDLRLDSIYRRADQNKANEQLGITRSMAGLMGRVMPNANLDMMDFGAGEARGATFTRIERSPVMNDSKYTLEE